MATTKVKYDEYGFYVRHSGFLFRPLFPMGFEPNNPPIDVDADDMVAITYKGVGASYAKLRIDGIIVFWMNHGSYIVPDGDGTRYLKSTDCILPTFNKRHA